MKKVKKHIFINPNLEEKLKQFSDATGTTQSSVINLALIEYLEKYASYCDVDVKLLQKKLVA